jgi:dipeptidase E
MRGKTPQIVALGGGGFSMERDGSLLDDYVLSLLCSERPRVCFLPTASGDADHYVVRFYRRFSASCEASHVSLFRRDQGTGGVEEDLASHLLSQDLIYVGGGNVVSMLGAWRAHGLDDVLRTAWRKGIVLCGPSAGSLCWFDEALSAFHGPPRSVRGLGLLPYSNCVHYDAEPARRGEYHRLVSGGMLGGFAAEDGVALHFRRTRLHAVVSSRADAGAYHVKPQDGGAVEVPLPARYLGAAPGAEPLDHRGAAPSPAPGAARAPLRAPALVAASAAPAKGVVARARARQGKRAALAHNDAPDQAALAAAPRARVPAARRMRPKPLGT